MAWSILSSRKLNRRRIFKPRFELLEDRTVPTTSVTTFAGNAQHTANYDPPAQDLNAIHWTTDIDLNNSGAFAHYGAPLVTAANTVIVPVKTAANSFQINTFNGADGTAKYSLTFTPGDEYILPSYSWIPTYSPAIATGSFGTRLYYAGAGGTIWYIDNPDSNAHGAPVHLAFYGLANYLLDPTSFNNTVFINTPITADSTGNIFFGFRVQGTAPAPLSTTESGFARIAPDGSGIYVLASAAADNDGSIGRDSHDSAPALSNDETTLYVVVKGSGTDYYGYLLALDSTTLATNHKVFLKDPRNNNLNNAGILDVSTASPTVGPDGDVFLGVFGNPYNGSRGFLLHFTGDLTVEKTPGGFGWDYTPAIVPASMVPSYTGPSTYLIFAKYNNYAISDGDGVNKIALLDPNTTQVDPHPSAGMLVEMREVFTLAGPISDNQGAGYPNAVREWCINTAAVNPATNSIFTPSEDGHIYRWNLANNSLSQQVQLTGGIGEPYIPTVIGPDGTIYTLNGGTLFALGTANFPAGGANSLDLTVTSSTPDARTVVVGQSLTFTATAANIGSSGTIPTGTVTFTDTTHHLDGSGNLITDTATLATNVPLDPTGHASITASFSSGDPSFRHTDQHFIEAHYNGDTNFTLASATLVQNVHAHASITTVTSSPNPSLPGQAVTFTATVTTADTGGPPTGMVTFLEGTSVLAQKPLSSGTVSFSTSALPLGSHVITAVYNSDLFFALSSGSTSQNVQTISTWDGGGSDDNWSTAANWVGDVLPVSGDALVFGSGAARLTNINNLVGTSFNSITFSAGGYSISGNGVTLTGGGVNNSGGSNTLNLPITLSTGQAFVASASTSLQVGGTINNGGALLTVNPDSLATITFTNTISGAGGLWKKGTGTLVVSGNNTYSGADLLSAGILAVGGNTALGSGTLTLQTATIQANGAARSLNNPVVFSGTTTFGGAFNLTLTGTGTLNANRTINITNTGLVMFSGNIGESGGSFKLSMTGPGTLRLAGSNTFTGGFLLNSGTLAIGSSTALGTGTFTMQTATVQADILPRTVANPIILNGTTTIAGSLDLTFTGAATLTANRTVTVNSTALTTFSGNIGESGGSYKLSKTGNGILKLSGNNTYTGGLTFAAGTFLVASNTAAGTGLLTLVSCTVKADGAARTLANAISFNGTTIFGGTLNLTFTGTATLTGSRTLQVDNTGLTTFSGNIGQTATFKITKTGNGTLVLSGNNTFSGGFQINAGTFSIGSNTAAGTGLITILGGTMQANGAARTLTNALLLGNFTIAGSLDLTFTGAATLNGTRTITVTNTALSTIAGNIGQDAAGRALTKAGAGTLVLSGTNTYTGTTNVSGGLLRIDGSQTGSAVVVKMTGTLGGTGIVGAVQVQAGGSLSPGASAGQLNTGNIQYLSGSTYTVELNGTTPGSGYDVVNATGTVSLGGSALNVSLGFTPAISDSFTIINNDGADAVVGTFNGLAEGATFTLGGMLFQISYVGGTGNDVVLTRIS